MYESASFLGGLDFTLYLGIHLIHPRLQLVWKAVYIDRFLGALALLVTCRHAGSIKKGLE